MPCVVVPNTIPLDNGGGLQRVFESLNSVSSFIGLIEAKAGIQQIDANQDDHRQAFALRRPKKSKRIPAK